MSEVKRYDAVHLRYEENNIRYGEGCEVEVVKATDYDRELHNAIAAGIRMQDKCAALESENENLRLSWGLLRSENNALRQQRDKLAGLLLEVKSAYTTAIHWEDMQKAMAQIDTALAEIKP